MLRSSLIGTIVCCAVLAMPGIAGAKVYVNPKFPITGQDAPGGTLSPPMISAVDDCSAHVYVDSYMPKATVKVILNGTMVIGTATPVFAFTSVKLTQQVHFGDKLSATQSVNGLTSAPSNPPVVVGKMPSPLPAPVIDPPIYQCGRVVPVSDLLPGVTVSVNDLSAGNAAIGTGFTPNDWGSAFDPVVTSQLLTGHKIAATQTACGTSVSPVSAAVAVLPEPLPLKPPSLDQPVVGNDALTLHDLYTGALIQALDHTTAIGSGLATGSSNWMKVAPIAATGVITATQTLCHHSPPSKPLQPTNKLPAPVLLAPICPKAPYATARNTTIDATLVLLKNGAVAGNGGAAPGDVPIGIAPPGAFAKGDKVQVVQYIGTVVSPPSNTVIVDCDSVTTYHYDNLRSGLYANETALTPGAVQKSFALRHTVELDDQVDVQPLVMTGVNITAGQHQGKHDVVYVETENNTVYAIDAASGQILLSPNFGAPIPMPLGCTNNGPNVGIDGTPVIDRATSSMYVVVYTSQGGNPVYLLHELDLGSLKDKVKPVLVQGSHALTDGSTYNFNASYQRQRPGLLETNGNVYVGFGSFCDFAQGQTRGWILGWHAGTLAPLPANRLNDTLSSSPNTWFMTSIWMSGYGVAADPAGSLYFITGNSDVCKTNKGVVNCPGGSTYDGNHNVPESVVNVNGDLTHVQSLFTPSDQATLEQTDNDLGSGGALLLPEQNGAVPRLAAAAGKDGRLFLLNRDSLGGYTPGGPDHVVDKQNIGGCWCGQSYYVDGAGTTHIVSSGGQTVQTWRVQTIPTTKLVHEAASAALSSGQDPGFFTVVSMNGTNTTTGIVWAVAHPNGGPQNVTLYGFGLTPTVAAGILPTVFSGAAGVWPNTNGNANIVPVVSAGRVYVASYKRLTIFGL
jgi:hypothetical protein